MQTKKIALLLIRFQAWIFIFYAAYAAISFFEHIELIIFQTQTSSTSPFYRIEAFSDFIRVAVHLITAALLLRFPNTLATFLCKNIADE